MVALRTEVSRYKLSPTKLDGEIFANLWAKFG